ncbi:MAG: 6-phospho-3-hexuloisomerase [Candidatus Hecatellales archaeon]|nr:MAG: 6-phospho-3-hexuloisomerase [Candidatus Hecatellales archaeon]
MQYVQRAIDEIIDALSKCLKRVDMKQVEKFIDMLLDAKEKNKKILVMGAGRSGLVGRAFAMRLMHLNFNVHVIGETITPALEKDDILVAISGSGSTTTVVAAARIAKKVGAKILSITSYPNSPLGRLSHHKIVILGRTKISGKKDYFSRQILGVHEPLAPLGTIFEASTSIFLDALIVELMHRLGKTEEDLKKRHATIE